MSADAASDLPAERRPPGLGYWMSEVVRECDSVQCNFAAGPVHDLRVALRRCRSIADGFMTLDPHPAWRLMKDESKRLFQQLGALRDVQIMREWVQRLAPVPDEASFILQSHLEEQENLHRESAAKAVLDFNRKKWTSWARTLSGRIRSIPADSIVFHHLALERWTAVRELHRQALRNRTHVGYHRVRIAIKKFRYIAENFLPSQHGQWGADLRELQDLLGEMHDLYVLWRTALAIRAIRNESVRREWRQRILNESGQRLLAYRAKMMGKTSLLIRWRSELPGPDQIQNAAMTRLRVWASYRDRDALHSGNVARLAVQIFDGLNALNLLPSRGMQDARSLLQTAALARAIGANKSQKRYQIASYRMLRDVPVPLGLSLKALQMIALIVRFHRGRLPRIQQKTFSGLTKGQRTNIIFLSGILRLADALDWLDGEQISHLHVERSGDVLLLNAPGYSEHSTSAERVAAARHLLEVACRLPILIR